MNKIATKIPGCFKIIFNKQTDKRGAFVKTFHQDIFKQLDVTFKVAEEYFTSSVKNVFRGLHFQLPPMGLDKIVFCVSGKVTDYVVDLRVNSSTFGQWISFDLDAEEPCAIFVPNGLAHGFYVKSDHAIMQYKVSQVYDAKCDIGITYTSFPFAKDILDPILSERDADFVSFQDFKSPFKI